MTPRGPRCEIFTGRDRQSARRAAAGAAHHLIPLGAGTAIDRWAEEGAGTMWRTGATGRSRGPDRGGGRRGPLAAVVIALPLLLAACGQEEPPPEATAVATAAATTAPTVEESTPEGGIGPGGSPAASPASSPAESGALTLGALVDRVDRAWAGVGSYRARFVAVRTGGTPAAVASPGAGGGVSDVVREVVRPDRQRQVVRTTDGAETEAVAVGGRLWVRGALARELRPEAAADAWVEVDPAVPGAGEAVAGLLAPATSPLAGLPENLRPQEVRSLGPIEVDGRTCQGYGAAGTTPLGARIDYTILLGPDDLPCAIESRSGQTEGREVFEAYGESLSIEPPAAALAPASPAPGATPATPAGRD